MSDDARRPGTIPWWYVGGFVFTIIVNAFLSDWLHASTSSAAVWGAILGMEFLDRRSAARAAESSQGDEPAQRPTGARNWRREAIATALITSLALGLGLVLGFVVHFGDGPRVAPGPAAVGALMMFVPLVVLAVVAIRVKSAGARTP